MIKVNTFEITYAQYLQIKKLYAIKFMFQWYSHSQVRSHTLCMCMFLHCIQQLVSYWSYEQNTLMHFYYGLAIA